MKKGSKIEKVMFVSVVIGLLVVKASNSVVHAADTETRVSVNAQVQDGQETFEEVAQLPVASIKEDILPGTIMERSQPHSIAAYKRLGYKKISYSKWRGTKKVMGTKSKRVAKLMVT